MRNKRKQIVIINEQHTLMDEQKELLLKNGTFERMNVPEAGWTLDEIKRIRGELAGKLIEGYDIVFASPIPSLILLLAFYFGGEIEWVGSDKFGSIGVFHNDKREKVELPNGRIIHKVAKTGWVIQCVHC